MRKFLCWRGFHSDPQMMTATYIRMQSEQNWFSFGLTTYMRAYFICSYCYKEYLLTWSYATPYEQWAFGGNGECLDKNGKVFKFSEWKMRCEDERRNQ